LTDLTSRRSFLLLAGAAAATASLAGVAGTAHAEEKEKPADIGRVELKMPGPVPRRALGKTGVEVAILGIGGYHLGIMESEGASTRLIHEALDHGLDFFDNAWEYHDGLSEERLGAALVGRRDKAFVMTKVCTHGRDRKVAMQQLEESLRRLRTDHLDLWQIHEVIHDDDPDRCFAPGGAIEALDQAKKEGKVRFVGFTGHKDPAIHLKMLARGYRFDAVQMPVGPFDGQFRSFERDVLPRLGELGIAPIGMKSLNGDARAVKAGALSVRDALGYAMSLPVSVVVSGIDSPDVLHQNLNIAGGFKPLSPAEREVIRARLAPVAADGRYELYKTSKRFDGAPGREHHGFPKKEALPG